MSYLCEKSNSFCTHFSIELDEISKLPQSVGLLQLALSLHRMIILRGKLYLSDFVKCLQNWPGSDSYEPIFSNSV